MKRTRVSRSFRRKVKKVLASANETKAVIIGGEYNCNSDLSSGDLVKFFPGIIKGDASDQRIGNEVTVKSCILRLCISYRAATAGFIDSQVIQSRTMVLSDKRIKSYDDISSFDMNIIRAGTVNTLYDGSLAFHMLPHDNEFHTVQFDKKHTFVKNYGYLNAVLGTPMADVNSTMHKFYTIKIDCPKKLKFDPNITANQFCQNFAPCFAVGYVFPQDLAGDSGVTGQEKLHVRWNCTVKYTDA